MIIALVFAASMLILAVYADSTSFSTENHLDSCGVSNDETDSSSEIIDDEELRYIVCPICYGYTWTGIGCSGINDNTSTYIEPCPGGHVNSENCTRTKYYYFNATYCRDCGYPRALTDTHHHSTYHSGNNYWSNNEY